MTIKRYFATADNTISNAFDQTLLSSNRATGSNMGQADILEVFQLYGQGSSSSGLSSELSRVLLQFDTSVVSTDRTNGKIPDNGGVSFYLKMYNARHASTTPENYSMTISAVSQSWQEGNGLDMVNYTDKTLGLTGSTWSNAGHEYKATATFQMMTNNPVDLDGNNETITLISSDGTTRTYVFNNGGGQATGDVISGTNIRVNVAGNASFEANAADLKTAIEHSNGHDGKIIVTVSTTTQTNDTLTFQQKEVGIAGHTTITIAGDATLSSKFKINGGTDTTSDFSGGGGPWITAGGDYHSSPTFTANFPEGYEDLEVDVTTLVEQWLAGTKDNYGFGVRLTDFCEAEDKSYYTKKFFARSTEFYYKRPVLEARWNDSRHDNRGDFYLSSSLAPGADNLSTIYLYNRIRGNLRNIPAIGTDNYIYVSVFSGSADNSKPSGSSQVLSSTTTFVNSHSPLVVTGGYVSTGVYSASFAYTGSSTLTKVYDVWWTGSARSTNASTGLDVTQFHTGTIDVNRFSTNDYNPSEIYILSISNLKEFYGPTETARFKLYARPRNWSPTIYTKAKSKPETTIITSASYEICRASDNYPVIPFGTGSDNYTMLSYNVSGNYFDLDMSNLQSDQTYTIKFAFYDDGVGSWNEQSYKFNFKVRNNVY